MILRDPPGDGSFTLEAGSTKTMSRETYGDFGQAGLGKREIGTKQMSIQMVLSWVWEAAQPQAQAPLNKELMS